MGEGNGEGDSGEALAAPPPVGCRFPGVGVRLVTSQVLTEGPVPQQGIFSALKDARGEGSALKISLS